MGSSDGHAKMSPVRGWSQKAKCATTVDLHRIVAKVGTPDGTHSLSLYTIAGVIITPVACMVLWQGSVIPCKVSSHWRVEAYQI